jgi:hypothetical protein
MHAEFPVNGHFFLCQVMSKVLMVKRDDQSARGAASAYKTRGRCSDRLSYPSKTLAEIDRITKLKDEPSMPSQGQTDIHCHIRILNTLY